MAGKQEPGGAGRGAEQPVPSPLQTWPWGRGSGLLPAALSSVFQSLSQKGWMLFLSLGTVVGSQVGNSDIIFADPATDSQHPRQGKLLLRMHLKPLLLLYVPFGHLRTNSPRSIFLPPLGSKLPHVSQEIPLGSSFPGWQTYYTA